MGEGRGTITASPVDECEIIVDAALNLRVRRGLEGVSEIGQRLREASGLIGKDTAIQERVREPRIELQGVGVITEGLFGASQRFGRKGPIKVTLRRPGFQCDTDAERRNRVLESPQTVVAEPFIEVRPEVLGP